MVKKFTTSFRYDEKTAEALKVIVEYMTEQSLTQANVSDAIKWSIISKYHSIRRIKGEDTFQAMPQ